MLSLGDTSSCCLGSILTSYLLDSVPDLAVLNLGLGKEMLLLIDLSRLLVLVLMLLSLVTTLAMASG